MPAQDPRAAGEVLGRRHREPFPTLRAAALQHVTAILGAHANEKPVRAPAAPSVRLERAFALHDLATPDARE